MAFEVKYPRPKGPAELIKQARFACACFPTNPNGHSSPLFRFLEERVQAG